MTGASPEDLFCPDRFYWLVPWAPDEPEPPWPYEMIAAHVRKQGGELLPGPWQRRVIENFPREPYLCYVFPAQRTVT